MAVKSYTNMYLVLMKKYVVCNVRGKYILNCMGMHHYLAVVAFVFNLMIPLLCTKDWATFSIPKLQQLVLSAFALPVTYYDHLVMLYGMARGGFEGGHPRA